MNPTRTKCLGCGQEVERQSGATNCPQCGKSLAPETTRRKMNWLVFFAVLLAPVVLTILAVRFSDAKGKAAENVVGISSIICGIISGTMLGYSVGKTTRSKLELSFLYAMLFAVLDVGMSTIGCCASGGDINIH